MPKLISIGVLLCAFVAFASSAQAQLAKPKAKKKVAVTTVSKAFEQARAAAIVLSKHPKLKPVMTKQLAALDELQKISKQIDSLVAAMPGMGSKELTAAKADATKLEQKAWEIIESIADAEIDEAKQQYEEAREQLKLAMKILREHMERQTQITQKIDNP